VRLFVDASYGIVFWRRSRRGRRKTEMGRDLMCGNPFRRFGFASRTAGRVFWASMVIVHAPILITSWRSFLTNDWNAGRLATCLALTISLIFFVLKFQEASFLRFRANPRSWVAVLLVLSLMHADMLSHDGAALMVPGCTTVVAATLLAEKLFRKNRRRVSSSLYAGSTLRGRSPAVRSHEVVWCDEFRPHCWVLSSRLYSLRAPPV
jgi:hypothetical protein